MWPPLKRSQLTGWEPLLYMIGARGQQSWPLTRNSPSLCSSLEIAHRAHSSPCSAEEYKIKIKRKSKDKNKKKEGQKEEETLVMWCDPTSCFRWFWNWNFQKCLWLSFPCEEATQFLNITLLLQKAFWYSYSSLVSSLILKKKMLEP